MTVCARCASSVGLPSACSTSTALLVLNTSSQTRSRPAPGARSRAGERLRWQR
jgi:hypothetical protein